MCRSMLDSSCCRRPLRKVSARCSSCQAHLATSTIKSSARARCCEGFALTEQARGAVQLDVPAAPCEMWLPVRCGSL
jgi:hypothetical protein